MPVGPAKGLGAYAEYYLTDAFYADNANLLKIPGYRIVNLNLHYDTDVQNSFIKKVDAYFEVRNVFNNTYVASANNVSDSLNATTGAENPGSVLAAGNGATSGTIYAGFPRTFVGGVESKVLNGKIPEAELTSLDRYKERRSAMLWPVLVAALGVFAASDAALAEMVHEHHQARESCGDLTLACAGTVTPAFGPDGALWVAARVNNQIFVAKSLDHGRSFTPPVVITPDGVTLDRGPDARPKILVDRGGRVIVAYATFRDKKFNGEVFYTRSIDGGKTFAPPRPITADPESQRFIAMAIDSDGSIFSAWLDKRNRAAAREKGETYAGAGLAFAWSGDHAATFSEARIAHDNTCECCRIAIAFAGRGRPVVLFRNLFDMSVRDHAIMTFDGPDKPGPVYRVSNDDWAIDACPHHGPSLAVTRDGTYHAAWFTNGRVRKGLFYARSTDGGRRFSEPLAIGDPDHAPGRPYLLGIGRKLYLAWKEFDGDHTSVMTMVSLDDGKHWSRAKVIATTSEDSDHPILVRQGHRAFLSWQTQKEGYRLIEIENAS